MVTTLRIVKQGTAVLDGTTLLDLTTAGVVVDNVVSGLVVVTIPDGVPFGTLDPGDILERVDPSGRSYSVAQFSMASAGGAYVSGDIVEIVTPTVGAVSNRDEIQDLSANQGVPTQGRQIYMPDFLMAFTTVTAGEHVINILLKPVSDDDLIALQTVGAGPSGSTSVTSSNTALLTASPTTGAVVLTPVNQEIDLTEFNTFYGRNAGNVGTHSGAVRNIGMGTTALRDLENGDDCIAIGVGALLLNTAGSSIVAIGTSTGDAIIDSIDHVLIGSNSGGAITDGDGDTCVGATSCAFITTGNRNTLYGQNTGGTLVSGNDTILVGHSVDVPAADTSDYINIGGTIIGDRVEDRVRIGGGIGVVTGDASLRLGANDAALITNVLTLTERDALTAENGMHIYVSTTNEHQFRENGEWVGLGTAPLITLTSSITTTTAALGVADVYRMTTPATTLTISKADNTEGRTFIIRAIDASGGSPITVDTEDVTIDSVALAAGSGSDFTASAVHNFSIGTVIVHTGFSESTYNGTFTVTAIPSTTVYEVSAITFVATGTGTSNPAIDGVASVVLTTPYDSMTLQATGGAFESIQ